MGGFFNSPKGVVIGYSIGSMYVFSLKYVLSTTKSLIQADLDLSDVQAGVLYTMFLLAIMISSPILGYVADIAQKYKKHLAIGGLILDGCAMCACSLCFNFPLLIIPRVLSGIGDGTFSTIAPSILSDYFPPSKRNMVLTTFFSISNIGAVVGFALSGLFGDLVGWRSTCVLLGLPSLLGLLLLVFVDPAPGATTEPSISLYNKIELDDLEDDYTSDSDSALTEGSLGISDSDDSSVSPAPVEPVFEDLSRMGRIKKFCKELLMIFTAPYVSSVIGFLFNGIAISALADWGTSFFIRYYDLSITSAGTICGGVTVICAFLGTVLGGFVCEYAGKYIRRHPHLLVSGVTLVASNIFLFPGTIVSNIDSAVFPCVMDGIAFILCYINYGPMNAYVINCVEPELRSRAVGLTYAFRNFGGCVAPSIIGAISDYHYGDLRSALLVAPMSNVIAGVVWILAAFTMPLNIGPKMTERDENESKYDHSDVKESIKANSLDENENENEKENEKGNENEY